MKYIRLLQAGVFGIVLVISSILFSGERTPEQALADSLLATTADSLINISKKVKNEKDLLNADLARLRNQVADSSEYLIGDLADRENFKIALEARQRALVNSWGIATDSVMQAARNQSNYDKTSGKQVDYARSSRIINITTTSRTNFPNLFLTISQKIDNDENITKTLSRYFEGESKQVFENIYRRLLCQRVLYEALNAIQNDDPLPELIPTESRESIVVSEHRLLAQLLDKNSMPTEAVRKDYLELVRDYILDVFIPEKIHVQLEPELKVIPEAQVQKNIKNALEKLRTQPAFTGLPVDHPLHKLILGEEPTPVSSEALLGHLTNLHTTLSQLHASIGG